MRRKSIAFQMNSLDNVFGTKLNNTHSESVVEEIKGCLNLFVVDPDLVSTKDLFYAVNLGCKKHNSWFLDEECIYDLVNASIYDDNINYNYILQNVCIDNTVAPKYFIDFNSIPKSKSDFHKRKYDLTSCIFARFGQERPLTFHEVLNLAFQYPKIFNEKISGMQAYGSRFTKKVEKNPLTDDTLEIYRKGNIGKAFLKMAREQYRYNEDTKIIPFLKV
ncbi:MAG: hypothetical protein KBD12_01800 [Candidatus Pacebacteria bacterium]|nr:hypothetical protein [Candidatus Paceibacterota bacterium]